MGLSTQRIIIMLLLINVIASMTFDIYNNPTYYQEDQIGIYTDIGDEFATNIRGEEIEVKIREGVVNENTVGNPISMGRLIWGLLTRGLNPFPDPGEYSDDVLRIIWNVLTLWRLGMYVIVGLELYLLFKNRKTN